MKHYDVVGLMYARACPLACKDCITESSPKAKGRMRFEQARSYLPAISKYSRTVCLTGGEPFLHYKDVLRLTREARDMGLDVSIVSGAGWVRREEVVRSKLSELKAAGLSTICVSWDRYHAEFSPVDRAVLLARVAAETGLEVKVRGVVPACDASEKSREAFDGVPAQFQSVLPIALGRAASLPSSHFSREATPIRSVCGVVRSPAIDHDGTVYACCGPSLHSARSSPLILGNANEEPLDEIFARAAQSPLLRVLETLGSYGFHELLKGHPLERRLMEKRCNGYSTICDMCLDVTNDPALVAALEKRIQDQDAKVLVAAASLWREKKLVRDAGAQRNIGATFNKEQERIGHAG